MRYTYLLTFLCLVVLFSVDSCSSGKKAYQAGNYFEAVMTSTNRLRRDANHKKSIETLREAYPMSVAYYDDRAKAAIASNAEFKWTTVVECYTTINVMYDEIRRSPGALRVIPDPVNYYAKLDDAKRNAAEEKYAAGVKALAMGNRDQAKVAYRHFRDADANVPGYKDVNDMMEAALWAATIKVMMEPIPVPRNVSVSAEFFDNKVSEFLHSEPVNEFVRFYTLREAQTINLSPDHVIQIAFDDFAVGQVFMQEREVKLERDSVVVGTYLASSVAGQTSPTGDANTGGNTTGTGGNTSGTTGNNLTGTGNTGTNPNPGTTDGKTEGGATGTGNTGTANTSGNATGTQGGTTGGNTTGDTTGGNNTATGGNTSGGNTGTGNAGGASEDEFPEETIDEKDKVTICHVPPGNETNRHTLVISKKALDAHLAHGDILGSCEDEKNKGKGTDQKPKENKGQEKKSGNHVPDGGDYYGHRVLLNNGVNILLASADAKDLNWLNYLNLRSDTVKVYATVKATYFHYRKTTTSKGVLSFRIIDTKSNAVLSAEKMPGEFVWVSEWATFNGDERALTAHQLQLTKQKEQVPPQPQDLFIEFTRPIYDQLTNKIREFYKGY